MSWFGSNNNVTTMLQAKIGEMNQSINSIETILNRDKGITMSNLQSVAAVMQKMETLQSEIQSLLEQLSASQIGNLRVNWIDGRSLSFQMWEGSFRLVAQQIHAEIERFERTHNF
ncbi:hypothetical protein D0T51_09000 [Parabacteroides sp. 52]|uniref:hypothetical protein n=1 Tax=unclassified Parabacteroides TaxID=2649774 RepID=UPI0013D6CA17|nr:MULTISPECIES: hypothetical protein [unclassified Parabacteroides]MDH6535297.1 hypothetical protein [Parabacteroides sp. PM5-20]NDV55860.1 hypothetical protein [Parabacteroides sp. 52]